MAKRKVQTGPYTVKWQGSWGFGRTDPLPTLEEAQAQRNSMVEEWKSKGFEQTKVGAYFFSDGQRWKSVVILGNDGKYVKGA